MFGALRSSLVLVVASYLFRVPALLNARSTNSDAAVVGLQAMHILDGERSALLWGSGYQTSADAFVAAAFFAAFGPTPLALMLSSLTLHVVATVFVFATVRRRTDVSTAFVLVMPLVFSPSSVHTYALYPPRQLSLTLALAALWAIDGGGDLARRRGAAWIAAGGLLYGLAVSADPYPMVLAPVVLGYGALVAIARPRRLGALTALAAGLLAGLVPFALVHRAAGATSGPMALTASVLAHNWDLLVRECLPWALSYKVYYAHDGGAYAPWDAPAAIRALQLTGAVTVGAVVIFGFVAVGARRIPWPSRRLGLAGALAFPVTLGAFLVSVMVMDHFSMRYLATLTLMLPFAALPAAHLLGARRFALSIAPHVVASAIGGWVGYGPFVRGVVPALDTPQLRDDDALVHLLRSRGITYAEADYWASYRLTFLFREQIVVVPTNASEDRYPPYRRAFEAAPRFAYVYDPGRSREALADAERALVAANHTVEKTRAGRQTVLLVTR